MKTLILALGLTAAVSFGAAADTSKSQTNCDNDGSGVYSCVTETDTPTSFSRTVCKHDGPNQKCITTTGAARIPEPSYEPTHLRGGHTVTIMRGMPER